MTIHHMACQITRDITPLDFVMLGFVTDLVSRTQGRDLADLQERIYAAADNVAPPMLHNTWVEAEYQLDISCTTKPC